MRLFKPLLLLPVLPFMLMLSGDGETSMVRQVLGPSSAVSAIPIPLDASDPKRVRVGRLHYLKGWRLENPDPAFGSFSSMLVSDEALLLLNDAGGYVRLARGPGDTIGAAKFGDLPDGPGDPYLKRNRDSESMTVDPRTGAIWVGFESRNAIWRYAPGLARAEAGRRPPEMRKWPGNAGAEAMARLSSGRFLVLSEGGKAPPGADAALLFDRDPTDPAAKATRFYYRPPSGFRVTDAAELPDGRVLVLHRRLGVWPLFTAKLSILDPKTIERDGLASDEEIATLAPPLAVDNMEALAITREEGRIIVWIASDDNFGTPFQKSLLLKFVLEDGGR
ncbi:esterase-like activity of phytase family protein [Sphingomonas colocasiae]|nr:esterase-like activity of phytase family protein [Sphingomonas colocasiae]